jgi:hypothetical protein
MQTDGWTDSHDQPNSLFAGICETPNTFHFVTRLKRSQVTCLRLLRLKVQTLIIA